MRDVGLDEAHGQIEPLCDRTRRLDGAKREVNARHTHGAGEREAQRVYADVRLQVQQSSASHVAHDLTGNPVEGTRRRAGNESLDVVVGA